MEEIVLNVREMGPRRYRVCVRSEGSRGRRFCGGRQ